MSTPASTAAARRPVIGIVPGDPNGIGAEILVKCWAGGALHAGCRPVAVGGTEVIEDAVRRLGLALTVRSVDAANGLPADAGTDAGRIDVIASAPFSARDIHFGLDEAATGAVSGAWLDHADRLARARVLDGSVMGPISAKAMDMAGTLHAIASHKPGQAAYLLLRSGALVIAHLTDHIPLRDVSSAITLDAVLRLIRVLAQSMRRWGIAGRIGVAGFNPHASGDEETRAIQPAVEQARGEGVDVEGPISPDSVFRHCIEGRCQAVIAMYHDQGHIAIKTWGFSGNNVVFLGPPYPHTTVAHGVAYDLAGSGRADHSMLENAILNAASLAAGRGFHRDRAAS